MNNFKKCKLCDGEYVVRLWKTRISDRKMNSVVHMGEIECMCRLLCALVVKQEFNTCSIPSLSRVQKICVNKLWVQPCWSSGCEMNIFAALKKGKHEIKRFCVIIRAHGIKISKHTSCSFSCHWNRFHKLKSNYSFLPFLSLILLISVWHFLSQLASGEWRVEPIHQKLWSS